MKVFLRVFPYVRRYPLLAWSTLACAIVSTLMVIVFPAGTQRLVNDVINKNNPGQFWPIIGALVGATFILNGLDALRIILNNHFEQGVLFDLRSDLYERIQSLPLRWFDNRATGDIMTRLTEDVMAVERVLIDGIEQGTVALLQIVIVAGYMFYQSPTLTLAALLPLPLLVVGALIFTSTGRLRYPQQRRAASALNSVLHDNIDGIRQIKTYTSEEREHTRFNVLSEELRRTSLVMMRAWASYNPSMNFLAGCGGILIAGVGTYLCLHHHLNAGILVGFLVASRFLYEPIGRLHQLNQLFQAGRAAGDRVFEILDSPSETNEATDKNPAPVRGEVEFRHVDFAYAEQPTLHDISLHANPGDMIALVGTTGAGKSTVINLLARFYEYNRGDILLDGRSIRSLPRRFLRENIALVTQESFLFNGTTAENLRVGKPDATEEEMWVALEAANAADFVRRLPKTLHSPVGERGIKLSVGEKQRISIARALLKNPPILILDEATASVDTATERLIQQALDRLMSNRTSFVIAHRLSTVRHADEILVLERGRITERGRHADLLENGGLYANLSRFMDEMPESVS